MCLCSFHSSSLRLILKSIIVNGSKKNKKIKKNKKKDILYNVAHKLFISLALALLAKRFFTTVVHVFLSC